MQNRDYNVFIYRDPDWVEIENVQGVAFTYGQQQLTDSFSPPVYVLTGRRPDLIGVVNIGDTVSVSFTATKNNQYTVTNYEIAYGIRPEMDTWTMQLESAFSSLARSVVTVSAWDTDSGLAARQVCQAAGVLLRVFSPIQLPQGAIISSQSVVNANGLDVFTQICRTSGTDAGSIFGTQFPYAQVGLWNSTALEWLGNTSSVDPIATFTDATPASTDCLYDGLTFGGLALNYADKVVVEPEGGAAQTVGTGNTAFTTTTYSATNADALRTAQRYFALLDASDEVPTSITFTLQQQSNTAVIPSQRVILNGTDYIKIIFRGSTYYAMILGQDLTSTPEATRITLHLCASANLGSFTLNSTALGVLDQNRLGI